MPRTFLPSPLRPHGLCRAGAGGRSGGGVSQWTFLGARLPAALHFFCLIAGHAVARAQETITPQVVAEKGAPQPSSSQATPSQSPSPENASSKTATPPVVVLEVRRALPVDLGPMIESALAAQDGEALEQLFDDGIPVDSPLANGDTPLLAATRLGRADLVSRCLDWCAPVDAAGADGVTPLVMAIVSGRSDLARQLVEAGADPNAPLAGPAPAVVVEAFREPWFVAQLKHDTGLTPLMLAAVRGDEALVVLMLELGGKPYQRSRRYTTDALVLACRADQIRCAQRLLRRDPDDPSTQRVVVTLGSQQALLFRGEEVVLSSKVSTGRKGYATPTGEFLITSKHRDWTSTIYKAPMPYLLRLNASAIGLHQGVVPGYPASHGCIRLPAGKAAAFFKTARIGDRVLIRQ